MSKEYLSWDKFIVTKIPSSVKLDPIIYEYIKKDHLILDIGCGFGKVSLQLAFQGFYVEGIDINETGILAAQESARKLNLDDKAHFRVGDATDLPYMEDKFDVVIMHGLLTIIVDKSDRNKIIQEAYRVLKPEGHLYIVDFGQTWHSDIYRERYLKDFPLTKEEGSFLAYNKDTGEIEYIAHHYTEKELIFLLVNNRFKIDYFETKEFISRSGNKVNGFVIISKI